MPRLFDLAGDALTRLAHSGLRRLQHRGLRSCGRFYSHHRFAREAGKEACRRLYTLECSYHRRILRERDAQARFDLYLEFNERAKALKAHAVPTATEFGYVPEYVSRLAPLFRNRRVLDWGCGYGASTWAIAELAARTYGVDIVESCIESARKRRLGGLVEFLLLEDMGLPFADASIDVVYSNDAIEHVHPDDAAAHLREARRVLVPRGSYVIYTPDATQGPHDSTKFFWPQGRGYRPLGSHIVEYSAADLRALMRSAGFAEISFPVQSIPMLAVAS